ncbi:MAG TPA: PP2C family protein-serine/threonine phosphatase [Candidatus Acidoferrum sp.]|jgi:sigma-B regulation protein RsbU (phosphoserine phosphatase)|nr:PP2C family protein-serine/threonine phosphatase [Candidatus Acidoferrum sp.]
MAGRENQQNSFWKGLSVLDWLAAVLCLLGLLVMWDREYLQGVPGLGLVQVVAILAAFYLFYRFWTRWRSQVLWSLRNRLIVAYLFIAVVPIILLLIFSSLLGQIIYSQLGAYLLYHDVEDRLEMLRNSAEAIAAAESTLPAKMDQLTMDRALAGQVLLAEEKQLPGLIVNFGGDPEYFREVAGRDAGAYAGLVQEGMQLQLIAMREVDSPRGRQIIELSVPVRPEFLEGLAPDLGPVDFTLWQTVGDDPGQSAVPIGGKRYRAISRVMTKNRPLLPAQTWMDPVVDGFTQLNATFLAGDQVLGRDHPVFAFFKARRSQLNHRIFASMGELSGAKGFELRLIGAIFLLIELAALVIGVRLTRAITRTISDLSRATQAVQEGNLAARVPVERRDQLGMLGESFNSMTGSIGRLINEQKQLQRLENEISIAREVQDQLFPENLPHVEGVEIEAICKAARSVSGDYYDFIQLSPTQVAIAIADISGKGISAALLMASLQAALRSQLLTSGSENLSTAELVSRLNKHLVRNTGDDRFATFLIAIYDLTARKLRYTNAGHLPGFCLSEGKPQHLDVGGIVLGIVDDYEFKEGYVDVPPDAVVIGYSDGLVEPENAYGEEFGVSRLEAAAHRVRHASPRKIAESLMTAAEEWSGSPEQADDMTVIVAKLR